MHKSLDHTVCSQGVHESSKTNDIAIKKALYLLKHRGMKEIELLFAPLKEAHLLAMPQDLFHLLLELALESDLDIYAWAFKKTHNAHVPCTSDFMTRYAPLMAYINTHKTLGK